MLDYALLETLAAVARHGSFERAAQDLNVTPSAISQRVKLLEERVGSILIKRGQPCTPTPSGAMLCQHAERVRFMEVELGTHMPSLPGAASDQLTLFRVAVNDDSMSTWFVESMADFCVERGILLDIVVDYHDHTIQLIRDGSVQGAVTTQANVIQGWKSIKLGRMKYLAVCSPNYHAKFFKNGLTRDTFRHAPQISFTAKDELPSRYVKRVVRAEVHPPVHFVPHRLGFVRCCVAGLGWGMCPQRMVANLLRDCQLVEVSPGCHLDVDLYWQCWKLSVGWLDDISSVLSERAVSSLNASAGALRHS